jgi:hypothetical protein
MGVCVATISTMGQFNKRINSDEPRLVVRFPNRPSMAGVQGQPGPHGSLAVITSTTIVQMYRGLVEVRCPRRYTAIAARCNEEMRVALHS